MELIVRIGGHNHGFIPAQAGIPASAGVTRYMWEGKRR